MEMDILGSTLLAVEGVLLVLIFWIIVDDLDKENNQPPLENGFPDDY